MFFFGGETEGMSVSCFSVKQPQVEMAQEDGRAAVRYLRRMAKATAAFGVLVCCLGSTASNQQSIVLKLLQCLACLHHVIYAGVDDNSSCSNNSKDSARNGSRTEAKSLNHATQDWRIDVNRIVIGGAAAKVKLHSQTSS